MINGLTYIDDFISEENSKLLIETIDSLPWQTSLKRRVQQYGPVYDYTTKTLKEEYFPIPEFIKATISKIDELNLFQTKPNQIIINEYLSEQGIGKHIDAPSFGPTIASLSLCEKAIMIFGQYGSSIIKKKELEVNSLIVLKNEARSKWWHAVPAYILPNDELLEMQNFPKNFINVKRRRVSITFRTVDDIE